MKPSNPSLFKLSLITLAIFQAHLAYAEETTLPVIELQADASDNQSSEQTKSYIIKKSSSATKLNIDAQETPQTVNVVTRQQMDDFNLNSTRKVLENTPGVTVLNQETERTTYMSRGFEISNILTDGVGFPLSNYNYNNTNPDTYFYDRVDVVKGADALTNAFGDPSATINNIRKRPTKEFQANAGISYGSWDTQRYEADISGSLTKDGRVRGRIMGFEQTGDSYLDHYSSEKNGFAGILDADLTDTTTITVGYSEQQNNPNANNWGALPLLNNNGQQISYSRSYNPNPDWAHWDHKTQEAFAELKQKLGEKWSAKLTYNYTKTDHESRLLYYYGNPTTQGEDVSLTAWGGKERNEQNLVNFDLQGTYSLFGKEHEAAFGYSHIENKQHDRQTSGYINDTNIIDDYSLGYLRQLTTNWASWTPQSVTWSDFSEAANYKQKIDSYYAATRLHISDDLKLLLGGNYVQATSKGDSYDSDMSYDKDKFSPYAGITYNFTPEYTGYASYTSIFRPQTGIDESTNQSLKAVEGKSYEVGLKSLWLDNKLTGTLAIFKTEQNNYPLRSSDGNPLNRKVLTSDLESQGVELGLAGQLTDNFNLSFGYAQFSIKDKKNGGQARTYNPTQTLNLLATYTVPILPKLKIGAGLRWQDSIKLDDVSLGNSNLIKQDAYALVDVMASYDVNEHISLQANGNNITDKKYLNSFPDGQAFYGEPANYSVAVKFKY
ncbi:MULTISPECIES: TonB-dependent siderophore receptor [unclassified Acinetobacter]|uniref:TonB-dependent siderophore receptor n=1 Tax=unclassified Acinetobacter TaxID=196816 RepID=UPI00190B7DCE|nr:MULTISPECIES: TonB-dependent siderophore receptor [unclassified Acinetobacter]MBK0062985.1 TonB-dependent siderophore receptor [Acinetobacter sp. S55]MBK0066597.1 TonB-dependent siderophore receptor [Acinetobacter sp. S54]